MKRTAASRFATIAAMSARLKAKSTRATRAAKAAVSPQPAERRLGRPRDSDIDRALLDATLSELAALGFSRMSVEGVAARCGVGKPSIYRRYADKTALAIAALADLAAHDDPQATGDLVTDLTRQLEAADANLKRCGSVPLLGTLLAELDRQPKLIETYRRQLLQPRSEKLVALLAQARDSRLIAPDANLETASLMLLGFLSASYIASTTVNRARLRVAVELIVAGLRSDLRSAAKR